MAGTGKAKARSDSLEAEEELREEVELREEERLTGERIEQQDLNQGMDTGTHSSSHHGVNWSPSYQVRPKIEPASQRKSRLRPALTSFICNAAAKMAMTLRIGSPQKRN